MAKKLYLKRNKMHFNCTRIFFQLSHLGEMGLLNRFSHENGLLGNYIVCIVLFRYQAHPQVQIFVFFFYKISKFQVEYSFQLT